MLLKKILGWTWMVWNIVAVFYTDVNSETWLFGIIFVAGNIYITAKYLESLK